MTAPSESADGKRPAQVAPADGPAALQAEAAQSQSAIYSSPLNAGSASSPTPPSAVLDAPPAATDAPRRSRATVAEKQIHHAGWARRHRAPKASLDLDALAKSLD
jgi:hypothetical protein